MPTETLPEVKGVPAGLVAEPLSGPAGKVSGVPEGLTAEPLASAAPGAPAVSGQTTKPSASAPPVSGQQTPVQGVPANVTAHPIDNTPHMQAYQPSLWEKTKRAVASIPEGPGSTRTLGDVGHDFASVAHRLWANPMAMSDEHYAAHQERVHNFFESELKKTLERQGKPGEFDRWGQFKKGAAEFEAGAFEKIVDTGESFTSPGQIALLVGTFGESALARAAIKMGAPEVVPAVKTLARAMQLHFTASMIEGTATGIEDTFKNAMKGDWKGVGASAAEGLVSGVMAKSAVDHEKASSQVHEYLEKVAREKYGDVESGVGRFLRSRWELLNSHEQALVLDETVKRNPLYQEMIAGVEAQNDKAKERTKKQQGRKLDDYYATAMQQAHDPNVTRRTITKLQRGRERGAQMEFDAKQRDVAENLKAVREQFQKEREQAQAEYFEGKRAQRPARRAAAAAERSNTGRVVSGLADKRDTLWSQRQEAAQQATENETPRRDIEVVADEQGRPSYPAMYWGESNTFGVASDASGQAVYRRTPRGVEWMGADGNFSEEPSELYVAPDAATADTLARMSAISANADSLADEERATPEHKADAEDVASIRRELVTGDIDAKEAQKRAGISEKAVLPDEFEAARNGKLAGPFHESSFTDYREGLRTTATEAGLPEEDTEAILDDAGLLARQQTEDVLHHVYRPGDYVTSNKGVKWTLDSKGVLHSDDGKQVPLMKRGVYSNDAIQLAQSGRVGYGLETREDRRARQARERKAVDDIKAHQEEVDRAMRLAAQAEGLEPASAAQGRADAEQKVQRMSRLMSRPPRREETPVGAIVRMVMKAPADVNSPLKIIANRASIPVEEVMRLALANDPARAGTVEAKVAGMEPGATISDWSRPDRPWTVEQTKNGMVLRSGSANPLPLDRLNPSDRVKQLVEQGEITGQKASLPEEDLTRATEIPRYQNWQEEQVERVKELQEKPAPEPRNEKEAKAQAKVAERRAEAVEAVATRAVTEALTPDPKATVEEAEKQAEAANEKVKVAEEAYAQSVDAQSKTEPKDAFPPRAPVSIGYKGKVGIVAQNGREFPMHYELLPLRSPLASHTWDGGLMVESEDYKREAPGLQPRTISDSESKQNALRAERRVLSADGSYTGYHFAEYADKTINGSMGPSFVDEGGRVIGGNTRLEIMRRHVDNLKAISDPEEREATLNGFKAAMRRLAEESGIAGYPDDGGEYVVVRMMDKPIESTQEAASLGMLFNKQIGVKITQSARGVSYAKAFTEPVLAEIGRRVDAYDGILPAIAADQEYFRNIVTNGFGVVPEEYADWFDDKTAEGRGLVLNDQGRAQFVKTLLGSVIQDTATLNRIEGKTPYRAVERALGYIVKMKALADRDISGKIVEALNAAADTINTDPSNHSSYDPWLATYHPNNKGGTFEDFIEPPPPEPDRVVEAIWRALHASPAATPRVFNDRLKAYIGEDSSLGGNMFATAETRESMAEAFNRAFKQQVTEVGFSRGDKAQGISEEEFTQALKNREMPEVDAEKARVRRNAAGATSLEDSLSAAAQQKLDDWFKKATAGRDLRHVREAMEIHERLLGMGTGEAKVLADNLRDAMENLLTEKGGASAVSEAAHRGLQEITGEEDPDYGNELLENEVFADAKDAGKLVFDTLDPRTASFDVSEFNTAFGDVEFRREPREVFPKPENVVDLIPKNAAKTLPYIPHEEAQQRIEEWKQAAKDAGKTGANKNKIVYSLFDESGVISKPWEEAGYTVRKFDIQKGEDLTDFGMWMSRIEEDIADGYEVEGILAQPPCTSFTLSGTRWWKTQHDAPSRDMVRKKYGDTAAELFDKPLDYANTLVATVKLFVAQADPKWYAMENPAYGRINTQNGLPKATLGFDPSNYGDPYTKRTQLWGQFNPDLPMANVEPTEGSKIHKLRGDDPEQKKLRSLTPEGFAYSFFMANHDKASAMESTSELRGGRGQSPEQLEGGAEAPPAGQLPLAARADVTLPKNVTAFGSGANSIADMSGHFKANMPIGVAVTELSNPSLAKLIDYAKDGHPIFVDSGAFSEVNFGPNGPEVVNPISDAEWKKRLDKYKQIAKAAHESNNPNVSLVAPDMVGSQDVTLQRLTKFKAEVRDLLNYDAHVLVPLQNGKMSPAEFFAAAKQAIGADHYNIDHLVPAFPMNKAAAEPSKVLDFVNGNPDVKRVHLLGTSTSDPTVRKLVTMLTEAHPDLQITLDANKLRSNTSEIMDRARSVREELLAGAMGETEVRGGKRDYTEQVYSPSAWANKAQLKRIADQFAAFDPEFHRATFMENPDHYLENNEVNDWHSQVLTDEYLKTLGKDVGSLARERAVTDVMDRQKKGKLEPPPQRTIPAEKKLETQKAAQGGYVTSAQMKEFVEEHPATKEHATAIMGTAKTIAQTYWDTMKPEGVERKDALDWMLRKTGLAGFEKTDRTTVRGEYNMATGILKMSKVADASTFVHEFMHVIAPMLTEEEWKAIDTIHVDPTAYKKAFGKEWKYSGIIERMEKLAYGAERFFRDENPTNFKSGFEVRAVLKKIKDMFIEVYKKTLKNDPLAHVSLSEESKQWFTDHLGIEGLDLADDFNKEVRKAKAQEKKIIRPEDTPHPLVKMAKDVGGKLANTFAGNVEDSVGERVDPRKPMAVVVFSDKGASGKAALFYSSIADGAVKAIDHAELIHNPADESWGVRFNTKAKLPPDVLNQELPEREERRTTDTPEFKRWFGDSKVVDEKGEPLRVYHATRANFDTFGNTHGQVAYFAKDAKYAEIFANRSANQVMENAKNMPAYLSLKNPLDARSAGNEPMTASEFGEALGIEPSENPVVGKRDDMPFWEWLRRYTPWVKPLLEKNGYDGVVQYEDAGEAYRDKAEVYVSFAPSQIKSAIGNRGTFDANDPSILHQGAPVGKLGLDLEEAKKRLANTPEKFASLRKLLELKVQNLEHEIRSAYGAESEPPQEQSAELPKQAIQEVKNARTDEVRKGTDGVSRVQDNRGANSILKPPTPHTRNAPARLQPVPGRRLAEVPASLKDVKAVGLEPLSKARGQAVGTVVGMAFDREAWVGSLKSAGLPESLPAPTVALQRTTADMLIFPGQKEIVQTALSALEQGDGFVVASATGTGKTWTAMAIAKEIRSKNPDAKILVITKNTKLLKSARGVAENSFGFEFEKELPDKDAPAGTYGVSYQQMIRSEAAKNTKWDLVLADESGEARNWFQESNKQGKMLKDVTANSAKAVYFSATPFHCLAPGTSVLMHNGTVKPVEEVCVGDLVMGPDSQPRLVRKLSHGFGQMYEVIPKKGDRYKVNENHILSLRMAGRTIPFQGAYGKRYLGWRKHPPNSVVNVSVRDYLQMRPGGLRSRLLGYRTSVDFPARSVPIDPYWLGLWLGDGSCREPSICVAEIDPEIKQYVQEYAGRLGLVATEQKCHSTPAAKTWRISKGKRGFVKGSNRTVPPNPLNERLRGLGLLGKDSINKHIPYAYKANSREVRLRLLAGIIDSDGSCSNMHISISTKSKRLADDIAFMARSLGFAAYPKPVFYVLSKFPSVPNWIVRLSGELDSIPVLLPRKKCPKRKVLSLSQNQAMPASRNAKDVLKVGIRVEPCGVGEFYGFELDGDQLFVLGDFTVTHNSPMEYGYLDKLNLWPKNGFDKWIENNFAHEKINDKVVARLDPGKQAKLRQQLIDRGQLVSQAISYDGFTAHFGVVPVTDEMKRGLDRIHEGFSRAKAALIQMKKKGLAEKISAFEATYTKAFLERQRLTEAIEVTRKARAQGWQVALFSETSSEDLFRREVGEGEEMSTYQELNEAMGGTLARIIPPFPNVFDKLQAEFGEEIGDYSGRGNSDAERERALGDFLSGKSGVLYSTYAAGGIGVSMHDADFPDRGIKGGDKPRVFVFLGPPYSGVLLEQAMGRGWRFGVKSDVHAVFLATDAEPDIRLMQQKVGPRMRALRASVLGEKDSLASVMSSYTDEEKVRARQEALAFQQGNEQDVTAASYQVRSKSRNVGIQDWSLINFPHADTAKNRGMKYGQDVTGGDWSNLYQASVRSYELFPDSPEEKAGNVTIDAIGNGVTSADGFDVPAMSDAEWKAEKEKWKNWKSDDPAVNNMSKEDVEKWMKNWKPVPLQNLEPADRDVVVGAASAVASEAVDAPVERDKKAAARQAMESDLRLPGDKNKWILTFPKGQKKGVWKYTGPPEDLVGKEGGDRPEPVKDIHTWYGGAMWTQEAGIRSIARQAGAGDVGNTIVRMNRSYQADADINFADFAVRAENIMHDNKLKTTDKQVMSELWDVIEGKRTTGNPAIQKAANEIADLHEHVHDAVANADVKLKTPSGESLSWKKISKDRNYMPHRIDWDAQVEDPNDGKVYTLREIMKTTFAEDKRRRVISSVMEHMREKNPDVTYDQVVDYLKAYSPDTPVSTHINRARTMNFPFIKKDWKTLMGYYREAADQIAIEKNFGGEDRMKLNKEIAKIPSSNGRKTINSMFDGMLKPQDWSGWTKKAYNAAIAYEAASKMTISVAKLPAHLVHVPMGLKGRTMPLVKALLHTALHPKEVVENATYVGTVARQLNAADVLAGQDSQGITHQIFGKSGFNAAYKMVRVISGESARVWMEQYALHELRNGNKDEARRLLRDVMLIGDKGIDDAIANGRFSPDDLGKAQVAFANMVAWSNNPIQMPGWARLNIERGAPTTTIGLYRAVRLTYALQSFALKSMSLLREHMWDEVMIHHNMKPLAYFLVAAPLAGQLVQGATAGTKGFIHRGLEGVQGKKHTEDAWDRWIAELEGTMHDPTAAKAIKFYLDSVTHGYGMDMLRMAADPLLNLATGEKKKAGTGFQYMLEDAAFHMVGPAFSDMFETMKLGVTLGQIEAGTHSTTKQKHQRMVNAVKNYAEQELPILRQLPAFAKPPKHPGRK